jgi:hypothetical protein
MSLPAGCGPRTLSFGHEQLNIKVRADKKARPLLRREQDLPTDSKDAAGHETSPTSRERQKKVYIWPREQTASQNGRWFHHRGNHVRENDDRADTLRALENPFKDAPFGTCRLSASKPINDIDCYALRDGPGCLSWFQNAPVNRERETVLLERPDLARILQTAS